MRRMTGQLAPGVDRRASRGSIRVAGVSWHIPEAWRRSRSQLDHALAKREWLAPVATAVSGGVDPPKRADQVRRDLRDWDAIRAWAADIPRLA